MDTTMTKPKITDVAREAHVSLGTVSNALNHPNKVRPETRDAVLAAIERLGYQPNQSARLLAGGRNTTLGLILPNLEHGTLIQIAHGASHEATRMGYTTLIATCDNNHETEHELLRHLSGTQVSGIMLHPFLEDDLRAIPTPSVPLIFLNVEPVGHDESVLADWEAQGRLIANHLIEQGAKHIAVIGRAEAHQTRARLRGIKAAHTNHDDVILDIIDAGEWNVSGDGYSLGMQLAQRPIDEQPDAILGLTDVLAAGALAGVFAAGVKVPEDIMVAGCEGNPLAWVGPIGLTTCSPSGYEMGRRAVRLLIHKLTENHTTDHNKPYRELVRPFLLARQSTGILHTAEGPVVMATIPECNAGAYL